MSRRGRKPMQILDAGEGFIDVLFLLLTFFIFQNVWQVQLADRQSQFIHDQKLDFVKAADEQEGPAILPGDERFLRITVGGDFVQFDKAGIVVAKQDVFRNGAGEERVDVERAVFEATQGALKSVLAGQESPPDEILVRLYFERNATVAYTVGVYDALSRMGFKKVQWGLESHTKGI